MIIKTEIALNLKFVFSGEKFQTFCVNSIQDKNEKEINGLKEWFSAKLMSIVHEDSFSKEMAYYQTK